MKPNAAMLLSMSLSLLMIGAIAPAPAHATPLDTNLIVNPGGEADPGATGGGAHYTNISITGWIDLGPVTVIEWGDPDWGGPQITTPGPITGRGSNFFAGGYIEEVPPGGDIESSSISQIFDVRDLDLLIDGGHVTFEIDGWFGGWMDQEDYATLTAIFLDSGGSELDSVTIGGASVADRGGDTELLYYGTAGSVPLFTADIKVVLEMTRVLGGSNDGYADNLSFLLMVPEPSTMVLLGMGLGGLGLVGRRSRGSRHP